MVVEDSLVATLTTGRCGYNMTLSDGKVLAGIVTPYRTGGIGQLCNDSAVVYDARYDVNAECVPIDGGLAIVARRRIKRGEEVCVSYGESYWSKKDSIPSAVYDDASLVFSDVLDDCDEMIASYRATDDTIDGMRRRHEIALDLVRRVRSCGRDDADDSVLPR